MNNLGLCLLHSPRRIHMTVDRVSSVHLFSKTRFSSRLYASSSNPSPKSTPHTPDTYQKDDTISEPSSFNTNVVSGQPENYPRTQRPFESPTGAYTTMDASKPYDVPTTNPDEEHSKARYGAINQGEEGVHDVDASDGPQDGGKAGRQ